MVRGRVQGVGFRYFVLQRARTAGLTGWVRNCADGSLELEAEGDRVVLEQFLETLGQGPPAAHVGVVGVNWSEGPPKHRGFEILRN